MLALMRYRRLPYSVLWGDGQTLPDGYPRPKPLLLPTFFLPDRNNNIQAVTDTTPIIRRLEREYPNRNVIPANPVLSFLNYLIEDYADEWLTKPMFHYRWTYAHDRKNCGAYLTYMSNPQIPLEFAATFAEMISTRQSERLYVVGSNTTTRQTIEDSYHRFVKILDRLIENEGFVLGSRPSSADFAIFGQLTQLAIVDPTPAAKTAKTSMRVRAWIDRVEDLSGTIVAGTSWVRLNNATDKLKPLLKEIGRVYVPFLRANAKAAASGDKSFETEIDGRPWVQPTFSYQVKCLNWIREEFNALSPSEQSHIIELFSDTECNNLFKE